ncbi:MAG: LTA synthase family protein [Bacteroidaceae bacterium]|nr:LTA synthase family protein [Bacteroidaceae bacterium]
MLLLSIGAWVIIRGTGKRPKTPATAYYSSTYYFNHAALNPLYNLFYTTFKKDDFGKQFRYMPDGQRREAIAPLFPTLSDSTEVIIRSNRPNILLIVMEGMSAHFIDSLVGTCPVARNISNIMQHRSYWFSNAYASSFQTDRGIICAMSGFPGLPSVSIMAYSRKIRSFPGLARTLRAEGYNTQMLYAGDMTYLNFADYFLATGYDKLLSETSFTDEERSAKWGVPDHITFRWLYDDIQRRQSSGRPWFTGFLTLSSHHPFDVPYNKYATPLENGFAYTDSCFGDFIHRLEQTPAWDNLLIACVADHGFNYSTLEDSKYPHIPLFFTGGAVSRLSRDDRLICQTDLPATILGQLGIKHDDFTYSRDVFSRNYLHPSALTTYPNGFQYRDSTGVTVFDILTDKAVSGSDPKREHTAKAILQTLYDDISLR